MSCIPESLSLCLPAHAVQKFSGHDCTPHDRLSGDETYVGRIFGSNSPCSLANCPAIRGGELARLPLSRPLGVKPGGMASIFSTQPILVASQGRQTPLFRFSSHPTSEMCRVPALNTVDTSLPCGAPGELARRCPRTRITGRGVVGTRTMKLSASDICRRCSAGSLGSGPSGPGQFALKPANRHCT